MEAPLLEPNIQILKNNRKKVLKREEIPLRDKIYREMAMLHAGESREKQFAYGFSAFLDQKSILIQKEDFLAGFAFHYSYNFTFPTAMAEDFDPAYRAPFKMDMPREVAETMDVLSIPADSSAANKLYAFKDGVEAWLYKHWHSGHILPGDDRLLEFGFGGILR